MALFSSGRARGASGLTHHQRVHCGNALAGADQGVQIRLGDARRLPGRAEAPTIATEPGSEDALEFFVTVGLPTGW